MPWWGWILVGTLLFAAELFVVEADFYLVFLGFSALVVGSLTLLGLGGPLWAQWLMFAVVAVGSTVFFRRRVYQRLRPPPGGAVSDSVVGEWVVVRDAMAPGALGQAELRGAVWSARNAGGAPLPPGGRARVVKVEGLILDVRSE
jgi:membrane protein implicated in regulation of membrane protease activity